MSSHVRPRPGPSQPPTPLPPHTHVHTHTHTHAHTQDFDGLSEFFSAAYGAPLQQQALSVAGGNWGKLALRGRSLRMSARDDKAGQDKVCVCGGGRRNTPLS